MPAHPGSPRRRGSSEAFPSRVFRSGSPPSRGTRDLWLLNPHLSRVILRRETPKQPRGTSLQVRVSPLGCFAALAMTRRRGSECPHIRVPREGGDPDPFAQTGSVPTTFCLCEERGAWALPPAPLRRENEIPARPIPLCERSGSPPARGTRKKRKQGPHPRLSRYFPQRGKTISAKSSPSGGSGPKGRRGSCLPYRSTFRAAIGSFTFAGAKIAVAANPRAQRVMNRAAASINQGRSRFGTGVSSC